MHKMKRHLAITVAVMAAALTGQAQSVNTLTLKGVVQSNANISVIGTLGVYDNLPILAGTAGYLLVANVTESCNSGPYHVTLQSANAASGGNQASLNAGGAPSTVINYTMYYGSTGTTTDGAVQFSSGSATVTQNGYAPGAPKKLGISFPANLGGAAGTYSDILTFTIAIN